MLFVLLLPAIAAPIVKGIAEDAIEESLYARATIDELSLSLGGSAHVGGIAIEDLDGRPLASVESVDASIGILAALGGTYRFDVAVDGVEAHVRRNADGSWNVAELVREDSEEEKERKRKEKEKRGEDDALELHGPIKLTNARVVVHGPDGDEIVSALEFAADFAGPAEPATVRGSGRVEDGTLAIEGTIPGDPSSLGELSELRADLNLRIDEAIDLAALGPALPLDGVEGSFRGDGSVTLRPGFDFTAAGSFELANVRVQGSREPVVLKRVKLDAKAGEGEEGRTYQEIELDVDDFLVGSFQSAVPDPSATEETLPARIELYGELSRLGEIAGGWIAVREGLELDGSVGAVGVMTVAMRDGAPRNLHVDLDAGFEELGATDRIEGPIDLGELADLKCAASLSYDLDAGALDVTDLVVDAGPLAARGATRLTGLDDDAMRLGETKVDVTADLEKLRETLGELVDLGEGRLGGSVEAHLTASEVGDKVLIDGSATARGLVIPRGEMDSMAIGDAEALARGMYFPAEARLELTDVRAALPEPGVEATGQVLLERLDREEGLPDVRFDLTANLGEGDLPGWLAPYLDGMTLDADGAQASIDGTLRDERFAVDAELKGRGVGLLTETFAAGGEEVTLLANAEGTLERAAVKTRATIGNFAMRTIPAEPEEAALELTEDSVVLELTSDVAVEPGDLSLEKLQIDSGFLKGKVRGNVAGLRADEIVFDGLQGDLTYVPDRLGVVLAPWLPGKLTGAAPEPCTFQLDGRAAGLDAASLLAGASGKVHVGVGRYETAGFDLTGGIDVDVKDGTAQVASAFDANGGELKVDGVLEFDEDKEGVVFSKRSTLAIGADQVNANSGLAPMLAYVHPAFGGLQNLQESTLGGIIGCKADLSYDGPLSLEALGGGWESLPKQYINGDITFRLDDAVLAGSPLITDLLSKFDVEGVKEFEIKPVQLNVREGRISYAKPWEWSIAGSKTTFGGSIGLDKTVALNWSIPITREMVAKNDFLKPLEGQTIDVPIGGTVTRPKLEIDLFALAGDLAKDALKNELKGALGLGNEATGEDPATLLKQADALWDQGKRVEAAAIYKKIRSEYKVSLVYALNRDRIKDRSKYREE